MSRTRSGSRADAEAARLEAAGVSRREIAARLGVHRRTVSRWLGPLPPGRPRVADDAASERTRYRRHAG